MEEENAVLKSNLQKMKQKILDTASLLKIYENSQLGKILFEFISQKNSKKNLKSCKTFNKMFFLKTNKQ
jgi:hypothetical protein